jgi:predicted XRE-type DNA-binding protein
MKRLTKAELSRIILQTITERELKQAEAAMSQSQILR